MSEARTSKLTNKATLIGFVVLAGAAALLSSVQQWLDLEFLPGVATVEHLAVTGQEISPALTLIALASLAAALVLTIAGKGFRRFIGLLIIALGAGLSYAGVKVITDPFEGAGGPIEQVAGISGEAQSALVGTLTVSLWPTVTVVVGALLALAGLLVLIFGSRWKTAGRKYESGTGGKRARSATAPTDDRISEWDTLSDGFDPTDDIDAADYTDAADDLDAAYDLGGVGDIASDTAAADTLDAPDSADPETNAR